MLSVARVSPLCPDITDAVNVYPTPSVPVILMPRLIFLTLNSLCLGMSIKL